MLLLYFCFKLSDRVSEAYLKHFPASSVVFWVMYVEQYNAVTDLAAT